MNKRYVVRLSKEERKQLLAMLRVGKAAAYRLLWARILLKVDEGEDGPGLSDAEARLIAACCSEPPAGRVRWTLWLLADRLVQLEVVGSISRETVRRTL